MNSHISVLSTVRATVVPRLALLAIAPAIVWAQPAASAFKLTALRCEYLVAPDNIDRPAPRLSWHIESDRRGANGVADPFRVPSAIGRGRSGTNSARLRGGAPPRVGPWGS